MMVSVTSPPFGIGEQLKKKRVLLVGTSTVKRDVRAKALRMLGIEVDCAADIPEARCWWKAGLYDLVLIDMAGGLDHNEKFCEDIRSDTPPQQLAFLVGAPDYLATSPAGDKELIVDSGDGGTSLGDLMPSGLAALGSSSQRWGILEASQRIGAVRSALAARTRAFQDRPAPKRDYEEKVSKRSPVSLEHLLREEMQ